MAERDTIETAPDRPASLKAMFARDVALAWSEGGVALPAAVFIVIAVLTPFAAGSDEATLSGLSAALLIVGLIVAGLTAAERIFQSDLADGTWAHLRMGDTTLEFTVAAKLLAAWVAYGAPLLAAAVPAALMLRMPGAMLVWAGPCLAVTSLGVFFLGGAAAALSAASPRSGPLIMLLAAPFLAPPALFAAAFLRAAGEGAPDWAAFQFLAATTLFGLVLGPIAAAAALRVHIAAS